MSKLGTHTGMQPTGLGDFLQQTFDAGSPVPLLFAIDINLKPDIYNKSPSTKLIFRTQQFGPDNGNMYVGDPIAAGRARFDQCWPVLQLNPADLCALDNEPGRADVDGLTWLCGYHLGAMQRADEVGAKLCIVEWSTGMPPISAAESLKIIEWIESQPLYQLRVNAVDIGEARIQKKLSDLYDYHSVVLNKQFDQPSLDYISIYTPMLRYAAAHGHILGLHEYSLSGPMIGSPLCLRYRTLYDALPADARPLFAITEAGPGAGYGTGYTMQPYIDVVAAYDAEVMRDPYMLGPMLFHLGRGESNMAEVMPLLTQYVIDHPTPIAPPPPEEREFDHWEEGGVSIGSDNPMTIVVNSDRTIKAVTRKKIVTPSTHVLTLTTDGYGSASGAGIYAHGSTVQIGWTA